MARERRLPDINKKSERQVNFATFLNVYHINTYEILLWVLWLA
jgi:hypothetical protein